MVSTRSNHLSAVPTMIPSSSSKGNVRAVKPSSRSSAAKKKSFVPATAANGNNNNKKGGGGGGRGDNVNVNDDFDDDIDIDIDDDEDTEEDEESSSSSSENNEDRDHNNNNNEEKEEKNISVTTKIGDVGDVVEEDNNENNKNKKIVEKKKKKKTSNSSTIIVVKAASTDKKDRNRHKNRDSDTMDNDNDNDEDNDGEEDNEEDNESDDDGFDSEGFEMPEEVEQDEKLQEKFQVLKKEITESLPTMKTILTTPMRKRNRKILFEWFHIYHNLMPCSQDRMEARTMIRKLYDEFRMEYKKFKQHKKDVLTFEKMDKVEDSVLNMEYEIIRLPTTDQNKMAIYRKYKEMREKSEEDRNDEFYKLKQWLQWALRVPYDRIKEFPVLRTDTVALTCFLQTLRNELDQTLYGMNDVKDQILLFVHHKLVHPEMKGCSLGLIGDPGVGKTSIARCLARVMDFPFEQISFGGIRTTEHLKGFDYTYVGSQPGEIVKCLSRMQYKNGILFLDEYEKVSENNDINAFLLHLTDFSQNSLYRDNYLSDVSLDLSCLWLIYSMNQLPEDKALRDRIFTIRVSGYSLKDKIHILRNFLLPKHVRTQDLSVDSITIEDEVASYLIQSLGGNEKGIRRLEQTVKDLVFKITFLVAHEDKLNVGFRSTKKMEGYPIVITREMIESLCKKTDSSENSFLTMYS